MTARKVIRDAIKDADLNLRDRIRLRLALRFRPEVLEQELLNHAQASGVVPATLGLDDDETTGAVDWQALAEFIKEVLPVILEFIKFFL